MGSPELGFFEDDCRRAGFTSPARHRGDGGASRETDSIFSTLRARRAGHGARARARLATNGSPVDSPSAEASGAEICLASPSRTRPAGQKKHNNTLLHKYIFTWYFQFFRALTLHSYDEGSQNIPGTCLMCTWS